MELVYRFRGSVSYRGGRYGNVQADTVLEEVRVLHLYPQITEGDWPDLHTHAYTQTYKDLKVPPPQ